VVAAVTDAAAAGMRGRDTGGIDHADLAELLLGVRGDQACERLFRRAPRLHQLEAERAVAALGDRLRRHGADPGQRPGDTGADSERAGLDRAPNSPVSGSRATIE